MDLTSNQIIAEKIYQENLEEISAFSIHRLDWLMVRTSRSFHTLGNIKA